MPSTSGGYSYEENYGQSKIAVREQRTLLDLSEKREKALARKIRELGSPFKAKDGEISRNTLHPPKQLSQEERN